jgi:carbonic anhydrase
MKKLIQGIIDFRKNVRPSYRETFARLALGQKPDALFIACSDSRVVPNLFASTDPGDLFVVRNVGNLVPPCGGEHGHSVADESEAAAIEFAISNLGVGDIIVCGHSECGAMQALVGGRENVKSPNLKAWLRHGEKALDCISHTSKNTRGLSPHNRLSQENVVYQIENLKTYPIVQEKLARKQIRIHGWWFDLANASVHFLDSKGNFSEIDETKVSEILGFKT